ncbi:ABC transporter ATP-binding protein [Ktedonobacter sp. SOSP1-85]|uniref:ABC transporter ATP-binding protein n=1 Tax=Ktedonobacter sp. SOSP1-85 TaxID=2778367 RepID=UPI001915944F|nr:ABC transporter ATP-binding protein [Ktedonobacter sp. SOSP1-85]GHO75679.1 ABC transporter ATP-binding protein [Ktedonobacter sp. SOSP1-85]
MSKAGDAAMEQQSRVGEPVIVLEHVAKRFGSLYALKDLSLMINAGETYGFIGPNGSGKTTLIRLLVGLSRPTQGTISILGKRVPSQAVAPAIGYMTQASALYNDLTARENLEFFASIYGLRGEERRRRIDEELERVELAERASSLVAHFSGGMKQRLSLACALVHRPQVILLDEPTVGVDPELRFSFWQYFAQLNREGVTIIVSTHHLDEASRCTRLGLLRSGELLAQGAPTELLERSGKNSMEEAFLFFAHQNMPSGAAEQGYTTSAQDEQEVQS